MSSTTFILRLSAPVSADMLEDLRAVIPAAATHVFINALDEESHTTFECLQSDESCSLAASAITLWRQLGHIHHLTWRHGWETQEVTDASQQQLFQMLKAPGAILQIT
ncbi:hypothetical protein [Mixta hanseatica]